MSDDESINTAVLQALADLRDPTFGKAMVEMGTLTVREVRAGEAHLRVQLSTPVEQVRVQLEQDIVGRMPDGLAAKIEWDVQVPTREVLAEDPMPGVKNVILVMSGKGGVGKSTCAVNLTLALKGLGLRVGLLDADVYGPSIPTMLGIMGHPGSDDGKTIKPLERFGVKLMSIGFLTEDSKTAIVWRGPMLHGALQQFLGDVAWGELDYLVLDLPPGTGDVALTLAQKLKVTGVVMVTTPQEVALQDVYKGVNMCSRLGLPILGVVENMSHFIDTAGVKHELFGSGGGEKVAQEAKAPLLGQVPIEPEVRKWGDEGTPVVVAAPESTGAKAFRTIAEKLIERVAAVHFERGGGERAPGASGPKRLKILR